MTSSPVTPLAAAHASFNLSPVGRGPWTCITRTPLHLWRGSTCAGSGAMARRVVTGLVPLTGHLLFTERVSIEGRRPRKP